MNDFVSSNWISPAPELRLVDGVWKAFPRHVPRSSSKAAGEDRPRNLKEKKAREERALAEKKAAETAEHSEEPPAGAAGSDAA
ncbi:MAG: hypothetical protein ACE5H3_08500 [Planctomycetota bacterium]